MDSLLTYCTNVHPGESWAEVDAALRAHTLQVRDQLRAAYPSQAAFPIGLRLSALAAQQLALAENLQRFESWLAEQQLTVFTINGFPYGPFHGRAVKQQVYQPDWSQAARVQYTCALARLLARWVPPGQHGSISSVPLAFKAQAATARHLEHTARHLAQCCAELARVHTHSGKRIVLALEPEPSCALETCDEVLQFFEQHVFGEITNNVARELGLTRPQAENTVRSHLGICLDTCHASVEFEEPVDVYRKLQAAGICVAKIQISAGLRVAAHDPQQLRALQAFDEPVYLHQVVAKTKAGLHRFDDLPLAFASVQSATEPGSDTPQVPEQEWRVHFHVPLFTDRYGIFSSTRSSVVDLLAALDPDHCPHLEVETYTWSVLPDQFRDRPVAQAISQELLWVRDTWQQLRRGTPQAGSAA